MITVGFDDYLHFKITFSNTHSKEKQFQNNIH